MGGGLGATVEAAYWVCFNLTTRTTRTARTVRAVALVIGEGRAWMIRCGLIKFAGSILVRGFAELKTLQ